MAQDSIITKTGYNSFLTCFAVVEMSLLLVAIRVVEMHQVRGQIRIGYLIRFKREKGCYVFIFTTLVYLPSCLSPT